MNEVVGARIGGMPKDSGGKALRVAAWVVQILAALMFLMAGSNKLRGAPEMVGLFQAMGIASGFGRCGWGR